MIGSRDLQDLQEAEQNRVTRVRAIAEKYHRTLKHLPKLKHEIDTMQQLQSVNDDDLVISLEQRLEKVFLLLGSLILTPEVMLNSPELEGLEYDLQNATTLDAMDRWLSKFNNKCDEFRTRMIRQKEAEYEYKEEKKASHCKQFELEMIQLPTGSFLMGATKRQVKVDGFHISKYPVTQRLWVAVMGYNPSYFKFSDMCPVERVSFDDAIHFVNKLSQMTSNQYRLPKEAEWEYAARSGGRDELWAGTSNKAELDDYAWTTYNSEGRTQPVGLKRPNGLGIYDMSGNVWEWCDDLCSPALSEKERIIRGGCWDHSYDNARTGYSFLGLPYHRTSQIGFRLALSFP